MRTWHSRAHARRLLAGRGENHDMPDDSAKTASIEERMHAMISGSDALPGSGGEHRPQEKFGTGTRAFYHHQVINHVNDKMREFIARQELMFIASADAKGETDCAWRRLFRHRARQEVTIRPSCQARPRWAAEPVFFTTRNTG